MADYIKLPCPICGKEFDENDDIVVCPICGTPHHRECYAQNGGCANVGWHSENKTYNADEVREEIENKQRQEEWAKREEQRKNAPEIICPRCSQKNSPEALFCNRCGAPVSQGFASNQNNAHNINTPYGRVVVTPIVPPQDPNEEIDGIPAWKLSAAVGKNSERVVPQFKFFAKTGTKISFNVFACLLTPFYFLYRKMYGLGIVTLILDLILSIPSLILNMSDKAFFEVASKLTGQTIVGLELNVAQTNFFTNLSFFSSIASFAISLLCAFFANWLYFNKCKKLCAQIDKTATSEEDFKKQAAQKGGATFKAIIVIAIVYGVICMFGTYLVTMFLMHPELFGL